MTQRWVNPSHYSGMTLEVPPGWKGNEVKNREELKQILAWNIRKLILKENDPEATPEENREARLNMARAALRELHSQNLALGISASYLADGDWGAIDSMLMDDMLIEKMWFWWDREMPLKITTGDPDEWPPENLEEWAMSVAANW